MGESLERSTWIDPLTDDPKREIPDDELRARVANVPWFQDYEIRPGIRTGGPHKVHELLPRLDLPDRLDGLRVLDVGANDGFFSFECERRGAREVIALDHPAWGMAGHGVRRQDGIELARQVLKSRIKLAARDIEADPLGSLGEFDVVLFLGVLYHLQGPLPAFRKVVDRVRPGGLLVIETHLAANESSEPAFRFWPGREYNDDPTNWFSPNFAAVLGLCGAAGLVDFRHRAGYGSPPHTRGVFHARRPARS